MLMQLVQRLSAPRGSGTLQHYARGFHSTATIGALGVSSYFSTLALEEEQTSHSLALSISQAIGYTKQFGSNANPSGWISC